MNSRWGREEGDDDGKRTRRTPIRSKSGSRTGSPNAIRDSTPQRGQLVRFIAKRLATVGVIPSCEDLIAVENRPRFEDSHRSFHDLTILQAAPNGLLLPAPSSLSPEIS